MQIFANLASDAVLGTDSDPLIGDPTQTNGKYILYTPAGVGLQVDSSSYLIPQNAGSLPSQIAVEFLGRNPAYDHQIFNYFLESTDIASLDLTIGNPSPNGGNVMGGTPPSLSPSNITGARCQVGRGAGPAPVGVAPNSVAVLPRNDNQPASTYGSIVTDLQDITAFNPGTPGTDEAMIWWKVATMATTEDVNHGFGATAGDNTPSVRTLTEVSPDSLLCYASVDNGASWYEARYLTPTDLVMAGVNLRIAFVNESADKLYLLGYVILFPDLP